MSCSFHGQLSCDPSKEQFIKQLNAMYEKNIIDFFPSEMPADSNWGSFFSSSWDESIESEFRCCAYFSRKVPSDYVDSIEDMEYIGKMNYSDSVFKINVPYMRHEESYLTPMRDTVQIPIADMRYSYFSLGESRDSLIIGNRQFVIESEIIPRDLVVYILEAYKGNFWKNRDKAAQEDRPILLDPWKHGCVKGLAVSRELSYVCWWAIAW